MSESEKTSPVSAFASPYHLNTIEADFLEEGKEILIPVMDMDDWADTCNQLKINRRKELEARIKLNPTVSEAEKSWMLNKVEDEMITLTYAINYRTNTPVGIRAGVRKQIIKQMVADGIQRKEAEADADSIVKKIHPFVLQNIARYIVDPPVPVKKAKSEDDSKNAETASMTEIGDSMPPSSESSGDLTPDA